jgi:NAD(P)-dependent dehydrogenase (short-subunit alcohol dehydrogenase family)
MATVLVTSGAGFIGSALVRQLIGETDHRVVNADCLTHAADLELLGEAHDQDRHLFHKLDICDCKGLGTAWLDAGTRDTLHEASSFVASIERRQGVKIPCQDEVAFCNGWIDAGRLVAVAMRMCNNSYGDYLGRLARDAPPR